MPYEITQQQLDSLNNYYHFYFADNGRMLIEGYVVKHPAPTLHVNKVEVTPLTGLLQAPDTANPFWPDDGLATVAYHLYCVPVPLTVNPSWARQYAEHQFKLMPPKQRDAYRVVVRPDINPDKL